VIKRHHLTTRTSTLLIYVLRQLQGVYNKDAQFVWLVIGVTLTQISHFVTDCPRREPENENEREAMHTFTFNQNGFQNTSWWTKTSYIVTLLQLQTVLSVWCTTCFGSFAPLQYRAWSHTISIDWLIGVQQHVNTERSICATCSGGKPAQLAWDGQRDTMHITLITR